jgi:hypothetical protein
VIGCEVRRKVGDRWAFSADDADIFLLSGSLAVAADAGAFTAAPDLLTARDFRGGPGSSGFVLRRTRLAAWAISGCT